MMHAHADAFNTFLLPAHKSQKRIPPPTREAVFFDALAALSLSCTSLNHEDAFVVKLTGAGAQPAPTPAPTPTPAPADKVTVQLADYTTSKRELRVEVSDSSSTATLRAYVTTTGALIGTLSNSGGGKYKGQFAASANPQNITVRSSLGGSASKAVAAK